MVELVVGDTRELAYFIDAETAEITHLVTEIHIVFLITRFFRSMRGEHETFSYFIDALVLSIFFFACMQVQPHTGY